MLSMLPAPHAEDKDPRGRLDADLEVESWWPTGHRPVQPDDVDPGAPSWWHGDEEASQSFLAAMGVQL